MYQRKTLRRMKPQTRKLAKALNEMELAIRRGKKLVDEMQQLEIDAAALNGAKGPAPLVKIESDGRLAHGWPLCPHCEQEVYPEGREETEETAGHLDGLAAMADDKSG